MGSRNCESSVHKQISKGYKNRIWPKINIGSLDSNKERIHVKFQVRLNDLAEGLWVVTQQNAAQVCVLLSDMCSGGKDRFHVKTNFT
jgi:hypothetical protein